MRLSAVLMRTFLILEPRDPQAKRNEIRRVLTDTAKIVRNNLRGRVLKSGKWKAWGRSGQVQARHVILQSLRGKAGKPGLYGDEMRTETGRFTRGRISSVGAMKAMVVRMIRAVMPRFTQFGGTTKKAGGRQIQPNAMLQRLATEYGHAQSNVGVSPRSKASARRAVPGYNLVAEANGTIGVKDDQTGKVNDRYNRALAQAFRDEEVDLRRHILAVVLDNAQNSGFTVK